MTATTHLGVSGDLPPRDRHRPVARRRQLGLLAAVPLEVVAALVVEPQAVALDDDVGPVDEKVDLPAGHDRMERHRREGELDTEVAHPPFELAVEQPAVEQPLGDRRPQGDDAVSPLP